jgi:Lar family restriction alleviation protein
MSLQLDPCPFCGCAVVGAEQLNLGDNGAATAVYCRACGARGPVRMTSLKGVENESVAALVADEWNRRIDTEEVNEHLSDEEIRSLVKAAFTAGHSFADESAEKETTPRVVPSVESPATADELGATRDPAPDNGGAVVAPPNAQGEATEPGNTRLKAPTPTTHVQPPGGGGALDTKHDVVVKRLRAWLSAHETTIEKAVKHDHIDLGVSAASLYHVLNGKKVREASLDAILAALDRLELASIEDNRSSARRNGPEIPLYDDAVVERLPNQFAPITGLKPIAPLAPPRRCARTP